MKPMDAGHAGDASCGKGKGTTRIILHNPRPTSYAPTLGGEKRGAIDLPQRATEAVNRCGLTLSGEK